MTGLVGRYIKLSLALSVLAFLVQSCAQQVSPTGGDKDVEPPKILNAEPSNETVGMVEKKITFEFDEYVQLKGANQELIVSPPLKYPVEFKMKNKKLQVSWRDTLAENATYLFQFGNGIVDVNESNPLDSNVFVFSTGPYIDSFQISGKVVDAFDLKPVPDVWVMLYKDDVDSLPLTELPRYFAKTGENGNFKLDYLSAGDYKVFALETVNGGYLYDVPEEAIAFIDGMVSATYVPEGSDPDSIYTLKLFVEEDSTQYIKSFKQVANKGLVFEFNREVETITVTELTKAERVEEWTENWSAEHDSVVYWFSEPNNYDSLRLKIEVDDFIDTIYFRKPVERKEKAKRGGAKVEETGFKLKPVSKGTHRHFKPWRAESKMPIKEVNEIENFIFIEAGDTIDVTPYLKKEFYGIVLDYPWKQAENYKLIIPDSLIFSQFGETLDTTKFSFLTSRTEDFGQLNIVHNLPEAGHNYIWQLLNKDGKVVDERIVRPIDKMKYPYLPTGTYSIRLFYDANGNEIWDTGYYAGKRQPEKVKYYDQKIEIRSNWATEITWNLLK